MRLTSVGRIETDALKIVLLRSSDPIMEGPMGPIPERSESPEEQIYVTTQDDKKDNMNEHDYGWPNREAHAQPVGRGAVRALGGEPVLPVLLRRAELLPQAAVRPVVADALAPAAGGGATGGTGPGEPVGGAQ